MDAMLFGLVGGIIAVNLGIIGLQLQRIAKALEQNNEGHGRQAQA